MNLFLLRSPRVVTGTGTTHLLQKKDAALLAVIALDGPLPRRRAAALLWPGVDAVRAANNLRQRLFRLRRVAGGELVTQGRLLALADGVAHDIPGDAALEAALSRDASAVDAELLEGHDHEPGELGAWVAAARERWRARRAAVLGRLVDAPSAMDRLARASPEAQQLAFIAAACGADFSALLAAEVMRLHAAQLVMPWRQLEAQRVFDAAGFADAAVERSVRSAVPAALLTLLQRDIASALARESHRSAEA